MVDRIEQILTGYIAMAQKQLEFIRAGSQFGDMMAPIPSKEQELMILINKWEGELQRHRERMNASRP
jgi:hypothetical protein